MKILWFTWKDKKNPLAGGAEIVNEELAKKLVADGHEVVFLVGGFKDSIKEEIIDGYKVIRIGDRWSVYFEAYKYYKNYLKRWADLVIDEVNTIPFFCKFYVKEKNILFIHQLAREIWFYQMFFPFNIIGYLIEPLYLRLLNNKKVITVSESTKNDLLKLGFKNENINIISEGIEIKPINDLNSIEKYKNPTILSLGSIRPMKRTKEILKAFEISKEKINSLKFILAGDYNDKYGKELLKLVNQSKFKNDIDVLGKVSLEKKIELMQKSSLICVTSVKEGWGLIVTEANSQGTPAVVYNVDGLRDAVKDKETGFITENNTPNELSNKIVQLLENKDEYDRMRINAYNFSKNINFEKCYSDFLNIIKL